MSDICGLARMAYDRGDDPLDYAIGQVALLTRAYLAVIVARAEKPAAFPGWGDDTSLEHLARRVVGDLLAAGWTPPPGTAAFLGIGGSGAP